MLLSGPAIGRCDKLRTPSELYSTPFDGAILSRVGVDKGEDAAVLLRKARIVVGTVRSLGVSRKA